MHLARLQRLRGGLRRIGCAGAVLYDPINIATRPTPRTGRSMRYTIQTLAGMRRVTHFCVAVTHRCALKHARRRDRGTESYFVL